MRAHLILVALAAAALGCDDGPVVPTSGDLQVLVATTGGDVDLNGYGLNVDGAPAELLLERTDTSFVPGLPAGPHDVELTGVAENCAVEGGPSRSITVTGGDTSRVAYPVTCNATGVRVSAASTGIDQDANGYRISLDGGPDTALTGEVTLTRLSAGIHSVALTDLAANCTVDGDNPRAVTVPLGEVVNVVFNVMCGAESGVIAIAAATSGIDLPGGYTVRVDDGDPLALGLNGTLIRGQIAAGEHTLALGGATANCTVAGENPRTVSVTVGGATRDTVRTTFQVSCVAATGVIAISAATSGIDLPDTSGYTVRVDDGEPLALPLNGTLTRTQVAGGAHTLTVSGVPANCGVAGDNPRSVTVTVGGTTRDTARTTFQIGCVAVTGALEIAIVTSGVDFDLDGYRVRVDAATQDVGVNDTTFTSGLAAGDYSVMLERVATNCQVGGSNPRTLSVTTGGTTRDTARTTFTVTCAATDRIAFTRDGSIMVANADGSSLAAVAAGYDPTWSPDGTALAFATISCYEDYYYGYYCYRDGLARTQANGSGMARLTNDGSDADPAWHPDGTRVAFTRRRDLYLINANGSGLTRLAAAGSVAHPAWSPDGGHIAFTCEVVSGNTDICVVNADGTGLVRLTSDTARDARPAWKPDGSRIAFTTTRFSGEHELALMNADGSGVTRVSPGTVGIQPAWSPDGTRIAFSPFRCDFYYGCTVLGVSVISPDGSGLTQITTGRDNGAAWRP